MTTQTVVARAVRFSLLTLVTASVSPFVFAADTPAINEKVERIEVTGSRIKRTDLENASPVVVVSAADIEKGGFNSVQDVFGQSVTKLWWLYDPARSSWLYACGICR